MNMINEVLTQFGFQKHTCTVVPFGTGLINNTWLVHSGDDDYIFQGINQNVFKNPGVIAANIDTIGNYLSENKPGYYFIHPLKTVHGKSYVHNSDGYFRMFPFVKNSHTIDVVSNTQQAYEAAAQFGNFTSVLKDLDPTNLHITLPDFHNLSLRYLQFSRSLQTALPGRKHIAAGLIEFLQSQYSIVTDFEDMHAHSDFKQRVTHHDTKISNVLFDEAGNGICVIDLDTVMPGFFISDVGDMMRTYLSPVSEEETDLSKIIIREEYFIAIVKGYLDALGNELSAFEKTFFVYAGKFMIYMQALRFITDYLNNDIYYGEKYEGHNYDRALNQMTLLQRLMEKEPGLQLKADLLSSRLIVAR